MANPSVNEFVWLINQNQINERLLKAEALLQVALNSELHNEPAYILHDYLWTLNDLIAEARHLIERSYDTFVANDWSDRQLILLNYPPGKYALPDALVFTG